MKDVLLIVNPFSGKGQANRYAKDLKKIIEKKDYQSVTIEKINEKNNAKDIASSAISRGFDTVICLGGDGTVNQTISGLMMNEVKPDFSFIPLGTVNDLGRALGFSMNPREVIRGFSDVSKQKIDVGQINNEYFINIVALGAIPESVMDTSHFDKNRLGKLAYIKDGFAAAFEEKCYDFEIIDSKGNTSDINSNLLLIGLTNSVGGYEQMNVNARVDDGMFYLSGVVGSNIVDMSRAMFEGKILLQDTNKMYTLEDSKVIIKEKNKQSLRTNIDGDPGPYLPIEINVLKQAINCLIPSR